MAKRKGFLARLVNAIIHPFKHEPVIRPSKPTPKPTAKPRDIPRPEPKRVPTERIKEYEIATASMDELKAIWMDRSVPDQVRRNAVREWLEQAPEPLRNLLTRRDEWSAFKETYDDAH